MAFTGEWGSCEPFYDWEASTGGVAFSESSDNDVTELMAMSPPHVACALHLKTQKLREG
jgi:hypothetical protein